MPSSPDPPFRASRTLTNLLLAALVVTVAAGFLGIEVVPLLVLLTFGAALLGAALTGASDFMLPHPDDGEDGA